MKIEKVNENQIRCTLTREDLADRQMKISELAYGTEKARLLFKDMIEQANYEFGFETNDIPLMVEAIPLSAESIILVITKVESPDELDTRFSRFSDTDGEYDETEVMQTAPAVKGADDIIDLFERIKKAQETPATEDVIKTFEFTDFEDVCRVSRVLEGFYEGKNHLCKAEEMGKYFLIAHKSKHTPSEFNKVCNIISEYGAQKNYVPSTEAYFREHGKMIIEKDAIQILAKM